VSRHAADANEEALTVAKNFMDSMVRRDVFELRALFHPDAVVEFPFPLAEGIEAVGAIRSSSRPMLEFVDSMRRSPFRAAFENIVWRTTSDGCALFEADEVVRLDNGRSYSNHVLMFFEVSAGRISRWRQFLNPIVATRAVALLHEAHA
jgi:ketosteroid isomerase-like protein